MPAEPPRLEGKVAIVTGAGATGSGDFVGIGQAISILFARHGAAVLLADRDQQNAETTLATIREEGGRASLFVGDVTSNSDCQGMVGAAVAEYGKINIQINNVGISGPGSVTDVEEDFWDKVIDVNLKSVMLTSKHAIPQMIQAGGGAIVNLSSIVGLRAGSGRPSHPYAASKGGIIGLSNSMAVHYGRDNIRVNSIGPGHIRSPMVARHSTEEMLNLRRRAGPWAPRGHRGMWPGRLCFWPRRRPAGSPALPCRWTPGCWRPRRWPCFPTCGTLSSAPDPLRLPLPAGAYPEPVEAGLPSDKRSQIPIPVCFRSTRKPSAGPK